MKTEIIATNEKRTYPRRRLVENEGHGKGSTEIKGWRGETDGNKYKMVTVERFGKTEIEQTSERRI